MRYFLYGFCTTLLLVALLYFRPTDAQYMSGPVMLYGTVTASWTPTPGAGMAPDASTGRQP